MYVLGISGFYHDSAAALVVDGQVVAAAQEERFTRIKHDAAFPVNAIGYCLQSLGLSASDIDHVVFYEKPFVKFERLLETYMAFAPRGFTSFVKAMPIWLKEKLFQKKLLSESLQELGFRKQQGEELLFSEHHMSHAASAFYCSPFDEAIVLTMDGVGEWTTTSVSHGRGSSLNILKEIHFPHSLGLLYSAFTYYAGFKVNSGEYKVMGLAPYGEPKYTKLIFDHLLDLKQDGSFHLDLSYFDYCTGLRMTNDKFHALFGGRPRQPEERLEQRHMDLAASVQSATEEVVLRLGQHLRQEYGLPNLCLAGGVALNCVANGKLLRAKTFDKIWIQPAAGDAGGALGAALTAYHQHLKQPRQVATGLDGMCGSYLGPEYAPVDIERELKDCGAIFYSLGEEEFFAWVTKALVEGKAIGWFQGRMEFGPRALGARSIIADARSEKMQSTLNLRVKFRESFRPFAPAVLREDVQAWFGLNCDSPYMLLVDDVLPKHRKSVTAAQEKLFGIDKLHVPRSSIPAVTHVDYSARVQTVHRETNPRFHRLLSQFKQESGCPVLVNTSFNVRGEPIVCTPSDAFRCFMGTDIEVLAIGNCFLLKDEQDAKLQLDYKNQFQLD